MDRVLIGLALKLAAAIALAGIGHVFVAFQRDTYPLDGYVYYAAAALFFVWALRTTRDVPGANWQALREPFERTTAELRRFISAFVEARFGSGLLVGIAALNVVSAVLALLLGNWVAFAGWFLSVLWVLVATAPLWRPAPVEATAPLQAAGVFVETPEAAGAPRLLTAIAGVLVIAIGHLVIGLETPPSAFGIFSEVGNAIASGLRLSLPGDPGPAVAGLIVLIAGAIVFARATRGVTLGDRPPLQIDVRPVVRAGRNSRWLGIVLAGTVLWLLAVQAAASGGTGLGPVALWIAGLILIGATWRKIDADRGVRLGILLDWREALGLSVAVVAASAVWLLRLDRLPANIWGDEGAYWTMARDMAAGQFPMNVFGLGTYSYPAGGSVLQAMLIGLFGQTIWAWRIGPVITVVASIVPLYFLARSLLGRRVAFISIAFFASSPFALAYGRLGYLYAMSILPGVAGAALTVEAIRRDSRLYAFLAGVTSGAGFLLFPSARFAAALCALILVVFAVTKMSRPGSIARIGMRETQNLASLLSALVLTAAPALAYGLIQEPEAFRDKLFDSSLANVLYAESVFGRDELLARAAFTTTRDNQLFFEPSMYALLAARGWVLTAIGLHRPLFNEHYVVGPLAGPLALLYVMGLGWCLARARRPGYFVWPIWLFAGTFLLSAIETFPPHVPDLLPVVPALAVLAAVGVVGGLETIRQSRPSLNRALEAGILAIAAVVVVALGLYAYFVEMPQRYRPNLEMAMFWSALDLPRGSTLAFVSDAAYPPDFTPWGLLNFNTGVTWLMVEPANLGQTDWDAACAVDCRIFYTPDRASTAEAGLREIFGAGSVDVYRSETGETIGFAYDPLAGS